MTVGEDEFTRFEHEGWERVADLYPTVWSALTKQFVAPLLSATKVGAGMRVLDVACGPGYVAAAALRLGAHAIGVDFSGAMISHARTIHPGIDFREGDAQALAFPDASFDRVLMNFGVLHLGDPDRAIREARRVLRHEGRFGFTLWAKPEENPGVRIVGKAVDAHADTSIPMPEGPPYFRFADPSECGEVLVAAGFARDSITFATHRVPWLVPSGRFVFEAERDAGVRTAALLARQTPERLAAIRSAIEEGVAAYATEGGFSIPMVGYIVTAAS